MRQFRWAAAAAAIVLTGCTPTPTTSCHLAAPSVGDGKLKTDGRLLRDVAGRSVQLRGVNMGGRSKWAPFAPFEFPAGGYQAALDAYLDRAASWGIDVARVPFTWEAVEATQGADDAEFLTRYDALLDGLWKRGIRTIVDFHQDVYAQVYCGDGFPAWTLPGPTPAPHHDCPGWGAEYIGNADVAAAFDRFWAAGSPVQTAYASLWDRMVTRYASKPGVLGFELFNEPGWGSADSTQWEQGVLTPFFSTMATRVHAIAPTSLVFFEGSGTDGITVSTHLERPAGDGLVYMPHYYQLAYRVDGVAADLRYFAGRGRAWNVPVILGEFGVPGSEPDAEALLGAHWDTLEANGLGGTQWEYSTSSEKWNAEDLSLTAADGTENATVNALARPYLLALAGAEPSVSRAAGGVVTWHYTGAAGVTQIAVPARSVPKGFEVEVVGACADTSQPGMVLVKADADGKPVEVVLRPH